ncbi:MAG: tetratricopeptide repeat protein [Candidatus Brocadiaceae bacterium]|nr:tetratricopeptide repeat protein [Candidatus Brocadiaceae bacterium]
MEMYASIAIFLFGIITWIPFLNGVYGHDVAGNMHHVDQVKKNKFVLYKDTLTPAVGHYFHTMFMQIFWDKYNTKAFYWIMCLYTSISSVILFWVMTYLSGLMPAIFGSMLFSLYIVSPRLGGNWGPFEQLFPLPLFGSILCILISPESNTYALIFLGGMLLGHATLIKQTAYLYLPGFFLMVAGTGHSLYHHLVFLSGIILTNLIPVLYYWLRHNAFWEYLISICLYSLPFAINPKKYNKYYPQLFQRGTLNDKKARKQALIKNSRSLLPMLFLSSVGMIALFSYNFSLLYLGLLICLVLSISILFMRGTFFDHYWISIVPWLAFFAGFGLSEIIESSFRAGHPTVLSLICIPIVTLLFIDAIRVDKKYYVFSKDPYQFLRNTNGEALVNGYKLWSQAGEYIKSTTRPDDRILICGYAPHLLLYADRTHFTQECCLYTEDYIDIFNRDNATCMDFLNSIYKFRNFKIIKQKENVFHKGHPEIIVFVEGNININEFEKLTGIKYSFEVNMLELISIFRADLELTELMAFFENRENDPLQKTEEIDCSDDGLPGNLDPQDWDTAFEVAKLLLAKDPYNIEHLLTLGECLVGMGNYRLLFRFYNLLIEKKLVSTTSRLELLAKLGEAYCHQDKFKEAEEMFRNILKLKPDNPTVLNNLGFVYSSLDNNKKALLCFQKALELDPNNEDAKINLEQIKAMC